MFILKYKRFSIQNAVKPEEDGTAAAEGEENFDGFPFFSWGLHGQTTGRTVNQLPNLQHKPVPLRSGHGFERRKTFAAEAAALCAAV